MSSKKFSWELFEKIPIIGIVRGLTFEELTEVLPVYVEAGLTTIEITMNTAGAEEMIRYATSKYGTTLNIGAGTVCTKKELNRALLAEAQFIVSPICRKKIIRACVEREVPIFPGAFSPTEIYKAWKQGASMIKVYPARALGASYLTDVKAPLREIKLLPTGGVDLENLQSFKKAGASGYGIGGQLFNKKMIAAKDWIQLKLHFQQYVALLENDAN